jgi:hypothetical protein
MRTIFFLCLLYSLLAEEALHTQFPLPEKTFNSLWHFRIKGALEGEGPFTMTLVTRDSFGETLDKIELLGNSLSPYFFYEFPEPAKNGASVQVLELISSHQFSGAMIYWDEDLTLINAIPLATNAKASQLIVPQIPTNFFTWRTSFSLTGTHPEEQSSDLVFSFPSNPASLLEQDLWLGFPSGSYLKFTPYFDLLLGDLEHPLTADWGVIRPDLPDFSLNGVFTISKIEGLSISAAANLASTGTPQALFPLSGHLGIDNWLSMTNTSAEEQTVQLKLHYRDSSDPLVDPALTETVVYLAPFQRQSFVLGTTLFKEAFALNGQPTLLHLKVDQPTEEEGAAPVSEVDFLGFWSLNEEVQQGLGMSHFATPKHRYTSSYHAGPFDTVDLLYNTSDEPLAMEISVTTLQGKMIGFNRIELAPYGYWQLDSALLASLLEDADQHALIISYEAEQAHLIKVSIQTLLNGNDLSVTIAN